MRTAWLSRTLLIFVVLIMLALAGCGGGAPEAGGGDAEATESATDALVITREMVESGIEMKIGSQAVVKLDPAYDWKIVVTPALVVGKVADAVLNEGEQAVLEAKLSGSAVIQATGTALCKQDNPPCDTANEQLSIKVKVSP